MAGEAEVICIKRKQEYFCKEGWTGVSPIYPSGKINVCDGRFCIKPPSSFRGDFALSLRGPIKTRYAGANPKARSKRWA
jgi:hypothetical protein